MYIYIYIHTPQCAENQVRSGIQPVILPLSPGPSIFKNISSISSLHWKIPMFNPFLRPTARPHVKSELFWSISARQNPYKIVWHMVTTLQSRKFAHNAWTVWAVHTSPHAAPCHGFVRKIDGYSGISQKLASSIEQIPSGKYAKNYGSIQHFWKENSL